MVAGYNEVTLTPTATATVVLQFGNTAAADWETTEMILFKNYSSKYLIIDFYNTCDLGDILYQHGFLQTLWYESETMENSFPLEDRGVENGEGRFVRVFARQVKKYLSRTKAMPDYMAEVFHRMKLHDHMTLTNLTGDANEFFNLEVEHEWLWDDKYYARHDLTFDYNEAFGIGGCCNNIT